MVRGCTQGREGDRDGQARMGLALVVMVASRAVAMACTITLGRPKRHVIGVNGEVFAGIGVPQDCNAPLTVADLSAGRAPRRRQAAGAAQGLIRVSPIPAYGNRVRLSRAQ